MDETTTTVPESATEPASDAVSTPDETETPALAPPAAEASSLDEDDGSVVQDGVSYAVGDAVKIAEDFPKYRGEAATITALRLDPAGGDFYVADVELVTQKQVTDGSPIWFNNVALKNLVKVA